MQRSDQQARHNFVAHPKHQCGVKHVVRQRHCSRHRNHVAAEQAELHARSALGHAIAHGGYAASHLRGCAALAGFQFDDVRVGLHRRVGRQHVVVRSHYADVGCMLGHNFEPVINWRSCYGVRQVGAPHAVGASCAGSSHTDLRQVSTAAYLAAFNDAGRNTGNRWVDCRLRHWGNRWKRGSHSGHLSKNRKQKIEARRTNSGYAKQQ